ncbi:MAG TPA: DUF2007 domain-containing protein [Pseudomonadaceae bacterium]|nr:DUF2007 domain-containing protein [Pseudomonadaceae bacterium]
MKLVYKNENRALVYSVKNILHFNNIESEVKNEYGHSIAGGLGLANSLMELWLVDDGQYDKARAIIAEQVDATTTLSAWTCSRCGEDNGGNFQLCWNCQHPAPDPKPQA